jgi:hypothetical protein
MWPLALFCNELFAPRFFCKVGAVATFRPEWAVRVNTTVGMDIQPQ